MFLVRLKLLEINLFDYEIYFYYILYTIVNLEMQSFNLYLKPRHNKQMYVKY